MSRFARLGNDLYEGRVSVDFVGRKWLWYAISSLIVAVAVFGLVGPKLNLGIEFEGGVEYRVSMPAGEADQDAVTDILNAVRDADIENVGTPQVNTSGENNIRVQTEPLTNAESEQLSDAIVEAAGVDDDAISRQLIGPSWGEQVADRALIGLGVFLVLVVLLIWAYFREWKMSVAAIVALAHDVIITVGVYALSGFEVTPATVTGVLTILGFSLYDTVVVFDKVRENTKNLAKSHKTYAEAANLAINQTLVRSINTSIVALLPVAALLYVSVTDVGSGALKDLSLSLFVGMAAGIYSSVFIATPLLVHMKQREARVQAEDARALRHHSRREADRFAHVPAYSESMPILDDPGVEEEPAPTGSGSTAVGGSRPVSPGAPGRVTAGERPASGRPVADRTSAGRPQPTRKPRSQRGKG
ncbi:MAG: Protein translocase subunit SecF [uncultured Nocardioidaceae bacterium]|uniref:Protein-export membrane protein SecF n=1 Tax=uncultured Nocardioidaceae bacterium TaxID=253824 RepID=A0A6J4NL32_9ACTN|nr:MAG: Protein translocase subunit SecF [uncultured Nocardioidaceae bacterium]